MITVDNFGQCQIQENDEYGDGLDMGVPLDMVRFEPGLEGC